MDAGPRRHQAAQLRAGRAFFFIAGLAMFAWAVVAPFTKIRFGLDDGTLGLILLAGGLGGITAMPLGGWLMARFGSRALLAGATSALAVLPPLLVVAPTVPVFVVLLFLYGFVFGGVDIAMNAQAAVLETRSGGRQMSLFHAFFSLGGLAAALLTSLLLRVGASHLICALVVAAAMLLAVPQARHLPSGAAAAPMEATSRSKRFVMPNRVTIVLGLCCFTCFVTEGAVTDWGTIFLRFSRGMPLANAALGYAAFAVAMTAARLGGDKAVERLGPVTVMRIGCGVAACGLLVAVALPSGIAGIVGFGLVGLAAGNLVPLIFSAAGRVPGMDPSVSMPAVVGLGYAGFLTGPVVIGLIAHRFSLSAAFGLDAGLLFATLFAARAVA